MNTNISYHVRVTVHEKKRDVSEWKDLTKQQNVCEWLSTNINIYINLRNSPAEQRNQHVLYVSMWFNSLIRRQIFQDENLKKYCPSNSSDLFTAQAMVYMGLSAAQTTRSHAPKKDSY